MFSNAAGFYIQKSGTVKRERERERERERGRGRMSSWPCIVFRRAVEFVQRH